MDLRFRRMETNWATSGDDGTIKLWNLPAGTGTADVQSAIRERHFICFSRLTVARSFPAVTIL